MANCPWTKMILCLLCFAFSLCKATSQLATLKICSEDYGSQLPIVQYRVNSGRPVHFVLDSGAGTGLIFTKSGAESLKLKPTGEEVWLGIKYSTVAVELCSPVSIDGKDNVEASFSIEKAMLSSLEFPPSLDGRQRIAGIIGLEYMEQFNWKFNFDNNEISIFGKETSSSPYSPSNHFRIYKKSTMFHLDISEQDSMMFDTGSALMTVLTNQRQLLMTQPLGIAQAALTAQGIKMFSQVYLPSLTLGSITVKHLAADEVSDPKETALLGMGFLSRFNFFVDFDKNTVSLSPRANISPYHGLPTFPTVAVKQEGKKFIVAKVYAATSPFVAGLKEGDEIRQINGVQTKGLTLFGVLTLLNTLRNQNNKLSIFRNKQERSIEYKKCPTILTADVDKTGLQFQVAGEVEKRVVVSEVAALSRAAVAGMQRGDQILSVENSEVTKEGFEKILFLIAEANGKSLQIKILRGDTELQIILK
jgi:predicted aspartyl protease